MYYEFRSRHRSPPSYNVVPAGDGFRMRAVCGGGGGGGADETPRAICSFWSIIFLALLPFTANNTSTCRTRIELYVCETRPWGKLGEIRDRTQRHTRWNMCLHGKLRRLPRNIYGNYSDLATAASPGDCSRIAVLGHL